MLYVFLGLVFLYWICLLNKKHKFIFTHFLVNNYEASCIISKGDLIDFFIRVRKVFPLTLSRMRGRCKKAPPTSFSPVTSTNA